MLRESSGEKFIEELSLDQNLTFDSAGKAFKEKNLAFNGNNKRSLGLIRPDGRFSNLALVLSDQCPWTIKAAIFQGTTRAIFKDRKEFSGSVFKQLEDMLEYLTVFNKISSTFEGLYRVDHPDYPAVAIREAAINAIIHRDYAINGSTLVSLYENRLEFMSLGGTMPGVTRELMLHGVSIPRNEKLANVFFRLGLIEAYGSGIPRIFEMYAEKGMEPAIPVTSGGFLISLPNMNFAPRYAPVFSVGEKAPPPYLSGKPGLNKKERQLLTAMGAALFSKEDAADVLGLSASGAYKLLVRMEDKGILTHGKKGKALVYRFTSRTQ
jgi:ATP-dependent DNA helicase RecG